MLFKPLGNAWNIKCGALASEVLILIELEPEWDLDVSISAEDPGGGLKL